MAAVKDYKAKVVPLSKVHSEFISVDYDFAKDGGATGALDLFKAGAPLVILRCYAVAVRSVTTSASGTIQAGKSGDTAGLLAATAAANLEAGEVAFPVAADLVSNVLATDAVVQMEIATGALTDGAVRFVFEILAL